MFNTSETKWLIMSKDRKFVAKGTPRSRYLVSVDDEKDKKRFLTYTTKAKAENGFKKSWFYCAGDITRHDLEAVEVSVTINEIV